MKTQQIGSWGVLLDHGLASKSVPDRQVEDVGANLVDVQSADEGESVDGASGGNGDCVHKGDERQAAIQCEADD